MHKLRARVGTPTAATPDGGAPEAMDAKVRPLSKQSLLERSFDGASWWRLLVFADVLALVAAIACASRAAPASVVADEGSSLLWLFPPVALGVLALRGMYRENLQLQPLDEVTRIVASTSLAAMLIIAGGALFDAETSPARLVARAWVFGSFSARLQRSPLAAST